MVFRSILIREARLAHTPECSRANPLCRMCVYVFESTHNNKDMVDLSQLQLAASTYTRRLTRLLVMMDREHLGLKMWEVALDVEHTSRCECVSELSRLHKLNHNRWMLVEAVESNQLDSYRILSYRIVSYRMISGEWTEFSSLRNAHRADLTRYAANVR